MLSVVNVYLDHLKFCVVCIDGRRYVCCSECDVSSECNEPTSCLVQPIGAHCCEVMYIGHTPSIQLHPHMYHTVTLGFLDRPRWSDGAAGQIERYAGWWTKSGMIRLTTQTRVKGVGKHKITYCLLILTLYILSLRS